MEHDRLMGAVALYLGDREVAEDIAQETLTRACAAWGRVGRMAAPGAWAHRVALNLAKRHLRRGRAAAQIQARAAADGPATTAELAVAERLVLREAVAALPPRQRAALVLRYYADLSVADTALAMGCAPGTVKALCHKALSRLGGSGALASEEAGR